MKKFLALFAMAALLFAFVGCSKGSGDDDKGDPNLAPIGAVDIPGEMEFSIGKYRPKERYRTHYRNKDGKLQERYVSLIAYKNDDGTTKDIYIYEDTEKFDATANYKILDKNKNVTNSQSADDIGKYGYFLGLYEVVKFEDSTTVKSGNDIIRNYPSYGMYVYQDAAKDYFGTIKTGSQIKEFVKSFGGEIGKGNAYIDAWGYATKDDLLGKEAVNHQVTYEIFYKGMAIPDSVEYKKINGVDELTFKDNPTLNSSTSYKWMNNKKIAAEQKEGDDYLYFLFEGENEYPTGIISSATKIKDYGSDATIDDFSSYEKTDNWWYGWWDKVKAPGGREVWVCHIAYIWKKSS